MKTRHAVLREEDSWPPGELTYQLQFLKSTQSDSFINVRISTSQQFDCFLDTNLKEMYFYRNAVKAQILIRRTAAGKTYILGERDGRWMKTLCNMLNERDAALRKLGKGAEAAWSINSNFYVVMNEHEDSAFVAIEDILAMLRFVRGWNQFEPSRADHCLAGICTSTKEHPCPLYKHFLTQCLPNITRMNKQNKEADNAPSAATILPAPSSTRTTHPRLALAKVA